MLEKFSFVGAAVTAAFLAVSGAASAAVIDFTNAATGTSGAIAGGTTWNMTASSTLNNSQAFDGSPTPVVPGLSFQTDGYGVVDDEISAGGRAPEWIEVTFSAPTLVNAFFFLDLFIAADQTSLEVAQVSVDGGAPFSLIATDIAGQGLPGFVALYIKPILATVLRFTVLSSNDNLGTADGALAGIGLAPVPVPAAGLMLLGGLGGLAAMRRRKRA